VFQVKSYLSHWLHAVDEHTLQAPFIFDLYRNILKEQAPDEAFHPIDNIRKDLLKASDIISFNDLGAPTKVSKTQTVKQIIQQGSTKPKISRLLYRLARSNRSKTIIDLGTSLGLNTAHLAMAPDTHIYTFEGNEVLSKKAKATFGQLTLSNIKQISGDINETLPLTLSSLSSVDFAFIDANHRYEPTINYFDWLLQKSNKETIIVLDDIHWSLEMHQAWSNIISRPEVTLSIDLFQIGIVYFLPELNKQHYRLRV
jgi:predicted O-methyltransferase YrrM